MIVGRAMIAPMQCHYCANTGGELIWRNALLRVVLAAEPGYPCLIRVIANSHVAELTDLSVAERTAMFAALCAVEAAVRRTLHPLKMNLASLGNMVPHLHWHVVARFADDRHFPNAIWAAPTAVDGGERRAAALHGRQAELTAAIMAALDALQA